MLGVPQISLSQSRKNTLRGMHCSPYPKLVACNSGKILDVVLDCRLESSTYGKWCSVILKAHEPVSVYVPAGVAHGFLALEDGSSTLYIQGGEHVRDQEIDVNCWDPSVGIDWPVSATEVLMSDKDRAAPPLVCDIVQEKLRQNCERMPRKCKVLLLGDKGYIGGQFRKHLRSKGVDFVAASVNLENRETLRRWLDSCEPCYVICAAGIAGRPNINWCDDHAGETLDVNVCCQLAVAEECRKRAVHCTLILTGMLYSSELRPGYAYCEDDIPNLSDIGAYLKMRVAQENLLRLGGYVAEDEGKKGNVLGLRIQFPMSDDHHPRSTLSKLLKYRTIFSSPTPWTILDELIPVAIEIILRRQVGIFNWVNPGTMTHNELLDCYRSHADPTFQWTSEDGGGRSSAELSMEKLFRLHPDMCERVLPARAAAKAMTKRMNKGTVA